jgi:hypothetical protein
LGKEHVASSDPLPSKEILDGTFRFAAIGSGAIRLSHTFPSWDADNLSKLAAFQDAKDETVSP